MRIIVCLLPCWVLTIASLEHQGVASDRQASLGQRAPGVQSVEVHWENVPLGDAIQRLSQVFRVPIFVDRRVDFDQRVRLKIENATLDEVLEHLSADRPLSHGQIGSVTYLGPQYAAQQLQDAFVAAREGIRDLPPDERKRLDEPQVVSWPRLSQPRTLVAEAVAARGWRVRDENLVPHDLWNSFASAELTLSEQLSLLLIGFDLTYQIDANEKVIRIVPRGATGATASHGGGSQQGVPEATAGQRSSVTRGSSSATAESDGLQMMNRSRPGTSSKDGRREDRVSNLQPGTKQVYTLRVEELPVGLVLRGLADRLDWELDIDETAIRAAGSSLDTRVSFSVTNADTDSLLNALLAPAGLAFEIDGRRVSVTAIRK